MKNAARVLLGLTVALGAGSQAAASDEPPAGLTRSDWGQIRASIQRSEHHAGRRVTVEPPFVHEAQLFGRSDTVGQANHLFGHSVSVSGDTAVIGAPGTGDGPGSAYVFVRSGAVWTEQQKLRPADTGGQQFGYSVSVSGDTLVVGRYADFTPAGSNAGSAYVFVRSGTTWTEEQKLLASNGAVDDFFGNSVSISGDTLVVGAGAHDQGSTNAGSAYVFVRSGTTWTEQQELFASDAAAFDVFGVSVSISGDTVTVGAYGDDNPGVADSGSAYVFVRSGTAWTLQQKLLAPDAATGDFFGSSVSVFADTVVVGAYFDDTQAGSAYVFVRSGPTWIHQQKLLASDRAAGDRFGFSVSLSGNTAVVGAFADLSVAGSAYVFVRSGTAWSERQKLVAPDGAPQDRFGWSVSVGGDTVVAGAYVDSTPEGIGAGSAHVFRESELIFRDGFDS